MSHTIETTETSIAPLIAALDAGYAALREEHPGLPHATINIASGKGKYHGYIRFDSWTDGSERKIQEIVIAAETLHDREAHEIWGTLVHEAVHAFNYAAGIKDTSRGGRYHNKRFKTTAENIFGLSIGYNPSIGHSPTTVPTETQERWAASIELIAQAITVSMLPSVKKGASRNNPSCQCDCTPPRKIRVSRSTLEEAPIVCFACTAPFVEDPVEHAEGYYADYPDFARTVNTENVYA